MESLGLALSNLEKQCHNGQYSASLGQSYEMLNERYNSLFPTYSYINCLGINDIRDRHTLIRKYINIRRIYINIQHISGISALTAAFALIFGCPMVGYKLAITIASAMALGVIGGWWYNPSSHILALKNDVLAAKERLRGLPKEN